MAERTTVTQVVQIGKETTEGTSVAASKTLPSINILPAVAGNVDKFATIGNKWPTIHALGEEWSASAITGKPTYDEIVYLLSSLLSRVTPVQQGATTAYLSTASPSSTAPDTIDTFTIENGSSVRAHKSTGNFVSDLTMTFSRSAIDLSGTMMGQAITDGITLTAPVSLTGITSVATTGIFTKTAHGLTAGQPFVPTAGIADSFLTLGATYYVSATNLAANTFSLATTPGGTVLVGTTNDTALAGTGALVAAPQIPLLPLEIEVWLDTTAAGLGTTKLHRVLSGSIAIGNRFGALWVADRSQASYVAHVELPIAGQVKLMVEADAEGMGILPDMRSGVSKFLRFKTTSAQLAGTAFPYSLTWDFALQVAAPPSAFQDDNGVYAIEWTYDIVHDPTWGKATTCAVMSKTSAL